MQTVRRAWQCELSRADSAFLLAGMLTAAAYLDARADDEQEIRTVADTLYRRADAILIAILAVAAAMFIARV